MTGNLRKVVREFLADALKQSRLGLNTRLFGACLESGKHTCALRLYVFKHLAHIGETHIGTVERKERGRGKGDPKEMGAMLLGQIHRKSDTGLGRLGTVQKDEEILETHGLSSAHKKFILRLATGLGSRSFEQA